jgi:hypothetical protein
MTPLRPLAELRRASRDELVEQLRQRVNLVARFLDGLRRATSVEHLNEVLAAHADSLCDIGLHDEAARLRAYSKVISADFARVEKEAGAIDQLIQERDRELQAPPLALVR